MGRPHMSHYALLSDREACRALVVTEKRLDSAVWYMSMNETVLREGCSPDSQNLRPCSVKNEYMVMMLDTCATGKVDALRNVSLCGAVHSQLLCAHSRAHPGFPLWSRSLGGGVKVAALPARKTKCTITTRIFSMRDDVDDGWPPEDKCLSSSQQHPFREDGICSCDSGRRPMYHRRFKSLQRTSFFECLSCSLRGCVY